MEDNSQILLIPDDNSKTKLEYRRYLILLMYMVYGSIHYFWKFLSIDLQML